MQTFLIVDIEATCWAESDLSAGEMEMIQIGIILVNGRGQLLDTFCSTVKPEHSEVSAFCTELLGFTTEELAEAPALVEVMDKIGDWLGRMPEPPLAWYSWGAWDARQIARDCKRKSATNPFTLEHRNAKKLFQKRQLPGKRQVGLLKALEIMKMHFIGQHHDALSDASNVALLMPHFHIAPDGKDYDCLIEQAWLLKISHVPDEYKNTRILTGWIIEDRKGRFPAGRVVKTSPVQKVEGALVTTLNTIYKCEGKINEITVPPSALPYILQGYSPPDAILLAEGWVEEGSDKVIN